jgi:hypothetical protein
VDVVVRQSSVAAGCLAMGALALDFFLVDMFYFQLKRASKCQNLGAFAGRGGMTR